MNPIPVLVGVQLITGGTYLVAKLALQEFDPFSLACLRFLISGIVFVLILKIIDKLVLPERKDWPLFLWMALLGGPLNQGFFLFGIRFTYAAHGPLLYATTPMIVLCLSSAAGLERINVKKGIGVILGFLGVLLVLFDREISFGSQTLFGDALVFIAVILWGLCTLANKKLVKSYPPVQVSGLALSVGGLMFLPVGIPSLISQDYARVSATGILSVLYLALLTSVVAYLVWSWALVRMDSTKVAIYSNLQPIVAALLGWFFLGETITLNFMIGTAIVIGGVILTQNG